MSGTESVSFRDEICRVAVSLGRAPTDEQVADLEALARSRSYIDADAGRVLLNDGSDIGAFLAREVNNFALVQAERTPTTSDYVKLQVGSSTGYRKSDDPMAQIITGLQAAEAAALAREIAAWPNPWATGSENRTRQVVIQNKNPAQAAKMKAQARK